METVLFPEWKQSTKISLILMTLPLQIRSIHGQSAGSFRWGYNNSTQKTGYSSVLEKNFPLIPCMINSVTIQVQLGSSQNVRNLWCHLLLHLICRDNRRWFSHVKSHLGKLGQFVTLWTLHFFLLTILLLLISYHVDDTSPCHLGSQDLFLSDVSVLDLLTIVQERGQANFPTRDNKHVFFSSPWV